MMLPKFCVVNAVIRPEMTFNFSNSNQWAPTDIQNYVIIMYQHSGRIKNGYTHIVMCLSIDLEPQQHTCTVSLSGDTEFTGNFRLWQGPLDAGPHQIILDYRTPDNTVSSDLEWKRY